MRLWPPLRPQAEVEAQRSAAAAELTALKEDIAGMLIVAEARGKRVRKGGGGSIPKP